MIYDVRDCAPLRRGVWLASLIAWTALLALPEGSCHDPASPLGASPGIRGALGVSAAAAPGWALMLVAMMAPMTLPALYDIRVRSFASRRWRSSSLFLAGYGLVWMSAGGILKTMETAARMLFPSLYGPALAVGLVACVWQLSPQKQRSLNRCHHHRPLAAFGLAADKDALLMGLEHGISCVGSCWAMMLFPLLLPRGHLLAMAAVSVVMFCERLDPPGPPAWRLRGFQTAWLLVRRRVGGSIGTPPPFAVAASPKAPAGSPF
jgi:predicted metal-binding membrane protein